VLPDTSIRSVYQVPVATVTDAVDSVVADPFTNRRSWTVLLLRSDR
jgi:hypothetical protein